MKWHLTLSLAAAAVLGLVGCKPSADSSANSSGSSNASASAKKPKIVFVSNGVDPFWVICQAGVEQGGKDFNADASMIMPAEGLADQKRILEDLITKGTAGVAVSPIDPANQTEILNKVAEYSKLVTADSDAPDSKRLVYIGMSNYEAGRMAAQLMKEALPNGGDVMIFVGRLEQDNAKLRRQGFIDELIGRTPDPTRFDPPTANPSGNGYQVLGTLTDQFDRAKAKANVEDTLSKHPNIAGMIGLFAYNPPAILEALKQSGKAGKVQVIGFDENDATLKGIQDGIVLGTVVQNPYEYGYQAVKVLTEVLAGKTNVIPANKYIEVPARKIRKDTVDQFWDELKKRLGK
ncbi:substrate-binding domain-containing protein [bacterium]|nr:substrate-binding domain-containing protein [bacterium]